jgi:hypothetical protein
MKLKIREIGQLGRYGWAKKGKDDYRGRERIACHEIWNQFGAAENERSQNDWGGAISKMIYFIYCKNLCKYHNVSLPSTTIKKEKEIRYCCCSARKEMMLDVALEVSEKSQKIWKALWK